MRGMMAFQRSFLAGSGATVGLLLGLLVLPPGAQILPSRGAGRLLRTLLAEARGRHVRSWLAFRDVTAVGYYENLLQGSEEPMGRSLIGWLWTGERWAETGTRDIYDRHGFLLWEPKPGLNEIDPKEGPVVTNTHGMFAREYPVEKAAGTRRVALLGDSLSRGYGVAMNQRFDTLLEKRLNAETGRHFELLNFAVSAYRPTQSYDVAIRKAALFHPDVYLMTLTEMGLSQNWDTHLAELVFQGIDVRYDFLRQAVAAAGVRRGEDKLAVESMLARYRLPVLRALLLQLESFANRNSATVIVVFLSGVEPWELSRPYFRGIPELVQGMGIATVDLSDTFTKVPDLDRFRLAWFDAHPNAAGHQLIAGNLYEKLRAQPAAWSVLVGGDMSRECLSRSSTATQSGDN
jgi:lysophospholipase L1-like esterase